MTDLDVITADVTVTADTDSSPWTVAVEAWLKAQQADATRRAYRIDADQWGDWCAARGVDPWRAVRAHIDSWADEIRTHGGVGGKPAAPKTLARKLSSIASLYGYLVDEGVLEHSPTVRVKRPNIAEDYAATISLDEPQLERVLRAARAQGDAIYAACVTLAYSGARVSEVLGADVTDVVDDHGHRCLNVTRKGGKRDRVTLPAKAAHVLTRYMADRADGPLFLGGDGKRLKYTTLLAATTRMTRAAGLPPGMTLHPHVLRASFATISFDHGVPGDRIQDAMGHADPRTTRLYDRGRGKLRRKAEPGNVVAKYVMLDDEED